MAATAFNSFWDSPATSFNWETSNCTPIAPSWTQPHRSPATQITGDFRVSIASQESLTPDFDISQYLEFNPGSGLSCQPSLQLQEDQDRISQEELEPFNDEHQYEEGQEHQYADHGEVQFQGHAEQRDFLCQYQLPTGNSQEQYQQEQLEQSYQPQNTQPTVCYQPSFYVSTVQVSPVEPQVQPHYFYLPPAQPTKNPSPIVTETLVHTSVNPLSLSTDNFPEPNSSLANSLPSTPLPFAKYRKSKSSALLCKKGHRAARHKTKADDDDEDYQCATQEEFYPPNKVCRFTDCIVCQRELPDSLKVNQPSWASILRVVFYALKINYPHKEFFNLRNHVYDFVDVHWNKICVGKTRSEHWKKQLQDTLAHNKKLFVSGADLFKQKGFWRLDELTDPWEISNSGSNSLKESKERVLMREIAERRQQPKRAVRAQRKRAKLTYSL